MRKYLSFFLCIFVLANVAFVTLSKKHKVLMALPPDAGPRFQPGQYYELKYSQEGDANLVGGSQHTSVDVQGIIKAEGSSIGRVRLSLKPTVLRYLLNGRDLASLLSHDVQQPFEISQDSDGRINRIWFSKHVGDTSQALIRELLARIQVVVDHNNIADWKTQEQDTNGDYQAHYLVVRDDSESVFLEKLIVPTNMLRVDGGVSIELTSSTGSLKSLHANQLFHLALNSQLTATWRTKIVLEKTTKNNADVLNASTPPSVNDLDFINPDTISGDQAQLRAERRQLEHTLGNDNEHTLRESLADLNRLGRDAPSIKKRDAVLKLYAYISLYPERSSTLGETLQSVDADSAEFSYIAGALSQVGHDQAQAALVEAITGCNANDRKQASLIQLLAMVPHPNQASQTKLESMRSRDDVLIALGTLASRISASEPSRAKQVLEMLATELRTAKSSQRQTAALAGLGNSGSDEALSASETWFSNSEPSVRSAALRVARFVSDDKKIMTVIETMTKEQNESVRYEAARALGYIKRGSDVLAAQARMYETESSALVRGQLLRNLWTSRSNYPRATDILRKAAQSDPNPEVRQIAKTLLIGYSQ
ncbi:MAG: HEAT repeat domain-containing protein [Proteobacteria bacterium]|nr:HEAT repeat domain-containing protein [Pseudomonadota bacterium]